MTSPSARPTVYPGPFFLAIGVALYAFVQAACELAEDYQAMTPERIALAANLGANLYGVARMYEAQQAAAANARAYVPPAAALAPAPAEAAAVAYRRIGAADGYRAMQARFGSSCGSCDRRIRPGDSIIWHGGDRVAWHDGCEPRSAWRWAAGAPAVTLPATPPASPAPTQADVEAGVAAVEAELERDTTLGASLRAIQAQQTYTAPVARVTRTATVEAPSPVAMRAGEIVAGAAAEGHGVLLGWQGAGERTRAELIAALVDVGMPERWAPASKSAHRHAGLAMGALNIGGYVSRAERRGKGSRVGERTGGVTRDGYRSTPTICSARWTVMAVRAGGEAGEAAGRNVLIAELHSDDQLVLTPVAGAEALAEQVRGEFERCRAGEVYQAGEVTDWLRDLLITRFGAVRLGGNWYIPRRSGFEGAEQLCARLAGSWGNAWMLPALPIATTEQLRAGLARGLASEVEALRAELDKQRADARAAGREDLGAKAAARYLAELKAIAGRVKSYGEVIGAEHVAEVKAVATKLIAELEGLADATSQRGALLEWDITVEVPADGGWTPRYER